VNEIGNGYAPEKLTAYEFGWKTSLFDRRVRFNGAAFYYDYKSIQLFSLGSDGSGGVVQKIVNASKGRIYGMDADLQVSVSSRFKAGTGLGLLSTKYQDSTLGLFGLGGAFFSGDGKAFISAPKFNMTGYADYEVPVGNLNLDFHVNAVHTSSRNFDPTGRADVSGGAYSLVNGKISVGPQSKDWAISIWGKNIFNEKYKSFVADLSGITGVYETFYGAPATYGAQVSVRF
jgi:iron complex outermembrane recepter protein